MFEELTIYNGKIVDYYLVCDNEIKSFEEVIREKIEEGFQPFGSFCVDNKGWYYQPMTKCED